jgi:hypothetical protein
MPIQDNLHGALLISAIDFVLSFVLIAGLGVILALFPLINRLRKQKAAPPPTMPREGSEPTGSGSATVPPTTQSALTAAIHPGLSDQQLVVLLTAAAYEALGAPVRVYRVRPLTAKSGNWVAQARHDLQSHRLK